MDGRDALYIVVARLSEERHQLRLQRLRLVEQSLCPNLEATYLFRINAVLLDQILQTCHANRVDVLSVVDERHLRLSKTNRVLSFANLIKSFEVPLVYV